MKKFLSILLSGLILGNSFAQISVKGSDTCLPLLQKESEEYMKSNAGKSVTVVGGGSGVGIAALLSGTTDIAMASRKMKLSEKVKITDAGKGLKETVFAQDALAVIVHPSNNVIKLTREQLEGIFTGKIINWKEVGGDDNTIVVYSRETSSGTYEFFKESVLKNKNFANTALLMPATGAIIQSVSQTKGAIGYVGLAYLEKNVKALHVSYDKGKTFVEPSSENAKSKKYPVTRPLYLYNTTDNDKKVASFINFIMSEEGQKIVAKVGYVPLK